MIDTPELGRRKRCGVGQRGHKYFDVAIGQNDLDEPHDEALLAQFHTGGAGFAAQLMARAAPPVGGKGGGTAQIAWGGGSLPEGVDAALAAVRQLFESRLGGAVQAHE